jgi:hypothetical protein
LAASFISGGGGMMNSNSFCPPKRSTIFRSYATLSDEDVGKKQKRVQRHEISHKGDQYTFIAMSALSKAIISYRTGKRDSENTDLFIQDLRERILGVLEISTDGFHPYKNAIRDAFAGRIP